ncbi:MAG TPA: hypothetical protein VHH15_05230 [Actinophytocola sp.]|nr:hypothetical protein [Actinophytocola sp.]
MRTTIAQVLYAAARPVAGPRLATRLGVRPRPGVLRAAVAFAAAVVALFVVWSGWLYPLRPDVAGALGRPLDPLLPGAWGGPTLLGAWAVHALVALAIQVLCVAVVRAAQGRPR